METHSLTNQSPFARALSCGNGAPANGPVSRAWGRCGSGDADGEDSDSSEAVSFEAAGVEAREAFQSCADLFRMRVSETVGKYGSSSRTIEAKCEPASRASTEFLVHFVATDRMRNPVTLSSAGPPPDAYTKIVNVYFFLHALA